MATATSILDTSGKPIHANGKPRSQLIDAMLSQAALRRTQLSYDAARDSTEYQAHWAHSDALDADSANSLGVRLKLMRRSRHEAGSNGFYAGIIRTHVNMLVGVGPTLRMLTNSRNFNQAIERSFYEWSQKVHLIRKLRSMAHAKIQDGESFGVLQLNPAINDPVMLDFNVIEAEQVQTPRLKPLENNYIDGIKFDQFGNILWYDVLREHPGASNWNAMRLDAIRVPPQSMLHWFTAERPGQHRGIPAMTSTLNLGASSRRWREAELAAAETAADLNVVLTTQNSPNTELDADFVPLAPLPIQKRMLVAMPAGYDAQHFKGEHPSTTHADFNRTQVSEQARPLSMPYNAAACDSSTYSFASGKLDTLCYRAELDVARQECAQQVLDRLFAEWFREWTIIEAIRDQPPLHQWDWPAHPVIDAESEARAVDTQLKNGTTTLREAYSSQGRDYEDELLVMAEDFFGDASEQSVRLARQINLLRNVPKDVLPFVAAAMGIAVTQIQESAA